jgi:uncharacterized membrane protein
MKRLPWWYYAVPVVIVFTIVVVTNKLGFSPVKSLLIAVGALLLAMGIVRAIQTRAR